MKAISFDHFSEVNWPAVDRWLDVCERLRVRYRQPDDGSIVLYPGFDPRRYSRLCDLAFRRLQRELEV